MKVTLDHTQDEAANIRTFWFKPAQPMRYIAGQYTELTVPHDYPDERGIKRWFTLSSSPTDELLSITTKFAGDKSSTFKQALWKLPMGTGLHMADAMGDFVLPKDKTIPLVFVAGGIGVTPLHSMVKWLADTKEKRDIHLIYGVSRLEEVAFRPLFKSYGLKLRIVPKDPPKHWKDEMGSLSAGKILQAIGPINNQLIYLSGPEPMVEALEKDLLAEGVRQQQLATDFFPGYSSV